MDAEDDGRRLVAAVRFGVDAGDVELHLGRDGEELREHARTVVTDDLDLDDIILIEADIPRDIDETRDIVVFQHIRAVGTVHGHAAAARDESHDLVAGNRVAAFREMHEDAALALDEDAVAGLLALAFAWRILRHLDFLQQFRDIGRRSLLRGLLLQVDELRKDTAHRDAAIADGSQHIVLGGDIELLGNRVEPFICEELAWRIAETFRLFLKHLETVLNVLLALLFLEPRADLAARFRGSDDVQPVAARPVVCLVRDDRDDIAILQLILERHHFAVDLGTDAVMPDLRVDAVGKIDRIRSFRQVQYIALRRKDKDLIGEDIDLQGLEIFFRVLEFLLQAHHLAEPVHLLVDFRSGTDALARFLVLPMGGDTKLRHLMHGERADLDFERVAFRHDRRVQRLIAVRFRHSDIVLEPSRHRFPHRMDDAEHRIAVLHGLDEDTHGREVIDFTELFMAALHLAVDAVKMLRTAADFRLDAGFCELSADLLHRVVDESLALPPFLLDVVDEVVVDFRLEITQAEILQFPFDAGDAEPVRERCIDLDGLAGDALLLLGRHIFQRAHVVQAVGELDHDDADILRHGEEHLAVRLELRFFAGLVLDAAEFRDAVDKQRDLFAKHLGHLLFRVDGILDHVVQQGGRDRRIVEVQIREDFGDMERMDDIGFARNAFLILVCIGREVICLADEIEVGAWRIALDGVEDDVDRHRFFFLVHSAHSISPCSWQRR